MSSVDFAAEIEKIIGRPVEVEPTKGGNFIVVYFGSGGPFWGFTPEEALEKFYKHLTSKESPDSPKN